MKQSIKFDNIQYFKNGKTNNQNILFGRRATCDGWLLESGLSSHIESKNILCLKLFLANKFELKIKSKLPVQSIKTETVSPLLTPLRLSAEANFLHLTQNWK